MYLTTENLEAAAKSIRVLHAAPVLRSPYAGEPARLEAVSAQVAFQGELYVLVYFWDATTASYAYVAAESRGDLARLLFALASQFEHAQGDLFTLESLIHAATRPARRAVEESIAETGLFALAA
jgi:hypothetical protein